MRDEEHEKFPAIRNDANIAADVGMEFRRLLQEIDASDLEKVGEVQIEATFRLVPEKVVIRAIPKSER
jgi:hypothetical protein